MLPDATELFDTFPVYTRPALMLEAYRQIVGEDGVLRVRRALLEEHGDADINAAEFIALAKRIAARPRRLRVVEPDEAGHFFDQWLYQTRQAGDDPTTFFQSTSVPGTVTGTVPATLSLSLGGAPTLRLVHPRPGRRPTTPARSPT